MSHLVAVAPSRFDRWLTNFAARHDDTRCMVGDGVLMGTAVDGSRFTARLPFARAYDGPPEVSEFLEAVRWPDDWGVLLVRRGGFAMARVTGERVVATKVGSRHVQGRTAAGGQSQQRFARRRANQARQAFEAAAEHAVRLLGDLSGPVVCGGDRGAVDEVLSDPRLRALTPTEPWLAVPDPRRVVLDQAVLDAAAIQVEVLDTTRDEGR